MQLHCKRKHKSLLIANGGWRSSGDERIWLVRRRCRRKTVMTANSNRKQKYRTVMLFVTMMNTLESYLQTKKCAGVLQRLRVRLLAKLSAMTSLRGFSASMR